MNSKKIFNFSKTNPNLLNDNVIIELKKVLHSKNPTLLDNFINYIGNNFVLLLFIGLTLYILYKIYLHHQKNKKLQENFILDNGFKRDNQGNLIYNIDDNIEPPQTTSNNISLKSVNDENKIGDNVDNNFLRPSINPYLIQDNSYINKNYNNVLSNDISPFDSLEPTTLQTNNFNVINKGPTYSNTLPLQPSDNDIQFRLQNMNDMLLYKNQD